MRGRQDLELQPGLRYDRWIVLSLAGSYDAPEISLEVALHQELWMEHFANAPVLTHPPHGDRVDEKGSIVGYNLHHGRAARGPTVIGLIGCPNVDHSAGCRPVHG